MSKSSFQKKIKYTFSDEALMEQALTHSSYTREKGLPRTFCNERLEFLGDAFLDAIVGEELYRILPAVKEGKLTKTRALIVCEEALVEIGEMLEIGEHLHLGRGEEFSGGRQRVSIVADAVEALIGAIYLESGYLEAKKFVLYAFEDRIQNAVEGTLKKDYKSELQEKAQGAGILDIEYILIREEGPAHNKTFFVEVLINKESCGKGKGKSKKEAEQGAAKEAILGGYKNAF